MHRCQVKITIIYTVYSIDPITHCEKFLVYMKYNVNVTGLYLLVNKLIIVIVLPLYLKKINDLHPSRFNVGLRV